MEEVALALFNVVSAETERHGEGPAQERAQTYW